MMRKTLNVICWIVQGLLAITLVWAGYTKLFTVGDKLAEMWPWTAEYPSLVIVAGIADILLGIGIILPSLLKIRPQWITYSAIGIVSLMISAAVFHISRGEISDIGINVFVLLLAGFVVWVKED
ncbi:DoxX family protein [Olivibacter sp. SA151]|uniref:DoxX family protein n=1 Tax=Olivibacter jilunii TaxID=985016 RepID=UPI003F18C2EA